MLQQLNSTNLPDALSDYFKSSFKRTGFGLRRRAVLLRPLFGQWFLLCCTVEAFPDPERRPAPVASRAYLSANLFEDWLDEAGTEAFLSDIQRGTINFGKYALNRKGPAIWNSELVALRNNYMVGPGYVVRTRYEEQQVGVPSEPLLSPTEPYYPDLNEAARDWLGLVQYHQPTGEITFLLHEARAFFTRAFSDGELLRIEVAGSEVNSRSLMVKGAYWRGQKIHHFSDQVRDQVVSFSVPEDADRLEYFLMDSAGELYDFQRESQLHDSGIPRIRVAAARRGLAQQVENARLEGEGEQVEFKPFVDPSTGVGGQRSRTKLGEVAKTIVAFANTSGGQIYLGIDDTCGLVGIERDLAVWAKAQSSDSLLERYRGDLIQKLRGEIVGDVSISISFVVLGEHTVGIIEVSEALRKPLVLRDDNHFYVRSGANNRQLPPSQWEHVVMQNLSG